MLKFRDPATTAVVCRLILTTLQYAIKTLIYWFTLYTYGKNVLKFCVLYNVQNIMLYLVIGTMHKNTMKTSSRQFKCCFWHYKTYEITNGISMLNTHSPTVGLQCLPNNRKI